MIQSLALVLYFAASSSPEGRPDTNFKSIHQLQSEEHKGDTLRSDTVIKREPGPVDVNPKAVPPVKALGFATLLVVVIIILIILITILLVLRYRRKAKLD
jgi:cytochrome bd-type quinol oxidase subunit 1